MGQTQSRMTREEFEAFILHQRVKIYVDPYDVEPCDCRDINCHGWRLVGAPRRSSNPASSLTPLRRTT
jgi:hypothetical protein